MLRTDTAKKKEKISSAIYLVTSFFDDKEPLKWRLRTLSTDLISERVKDKSSTAMEMLSLFSIAKTVGLVSEMNCDILIRELSKLEHGAEKPLELMFSREIVTDDGVLPEPRKDEFIKDKTDGKS